jgi:hypothetical protein
MSRVQQGDTLLLTAPNADAEANDAVVVRLLLIHRRDSPTAICVHQRNLRPHFTDAPSRGTCGKAMVGVSAADLR